MLADEKLIHTLLDDSTATPEGLSVWGKANLLELWLEDKN